MHNINKCAVHMLLSSQQQYSPASRLDWDTANDSLPFDPNRKVDCCCVSWFIKLARRDMFVVCSLIFCWLLRWTYLLLTCYWFMRRGCHDEAALKRCMHFFLHESSWTKETSSRKTSAKGGTRSHLKSWLKDILFMQQIILAEKIAVNWTTYSNPL